MQEPYRLRLMVTYRNLFYTPIYVAVAGGFLYGEGLNVMFDTVPAGEDPLATLRSGAADIIQTGISRSVMALDAGEREVPLHIAEINRRDGFFLISRTSTEGWQWRDLHGARLIPIGFTPVPMTSLAAAFRRHGVDAARVRMIAGLPAEDALSAFRRGDADYIHMPNPQAQALIEEGAGHLAAELGADCGHLCYSSFAAMPAFIDTQPQVIERFARGFYKAQQWLASASAPDIAERVAAFFPEYSRAVLQRSVSQYKALGTWAETPVIGAEGYEAMAAVLRDGGLVKGIYPYERIIRPGFAERAVNR